MSSPELEDAKSRFDKLWFDLRVLTWEEADDAAKDVVNRIATELNFRSNSAEYEALFMHGLHRLHQGSFAS